MQEQRKDPYSLFIYGLNSPVTRERYTTRLRKFFTFLGIEGEMREDIQIPSANVAINVELGSSDILGNISKALKDHADVIICSDDRRVLEGVSSQIRAENVFFALVQDVPVLFGKMRFNPDRTNF